MEGIAMGTLRYLLVMSTAVFVVSGLTAQSAVNVKVGVIDRKFKDESSLIHCGISYGVDVIIEDSRFLFMPGLHYQQYDIYGTESRSNIFSRSDDFHQMSLPLSFGTWLFADRWIKVRAYAGGHINFIVGVDSNSAQVNLDRVTAVHPGWQIGGQLMLWRITFDARYYHDYRNVINVRKDSTVRGWEFLIGIAL